MSIPIQKNKKPKGKIVRRKRPVSILAACTCTIFCLLACGCTDSGGTDDIPSVTTVLNRSADWTEETHGNDADPNNSVVFPDDEVNEITIAITPENWQTMLDDMTAEFGEFGGTTNTQDRAMGGEREIGGGGGRNPDNAFDFTPVTVPADITFNDTEWTDVGIRFKGQSTLGNTWTSGSYKISLKLNFDTFEDENPDIKNQRFYGFDELNLKSGFGDNSLMRDKIAPEIFSDAGVVAPETAYYRVYVDYGEGPVYFGLYTMIESVEDTLIETAFPDDSGNVYKPEGIGATFAEGTFDTECFEKKTNEKDGNWSDVEALYTMLNDDTRTTDPDEWRENLEDVFNVDGFIRWLAVNTAIQNWDTYGIASKNYYLYTNPSDGTITWIPWDNNEAISEGKNAETAGRQPMGMPNDGQTMTEIPDFGGEMQPPERAEGEDAMAPPGGERVMGGQRMAPPFENTENSGMMQNEGARMGTPLSLSLDEVDDSWPLIRYLMDDPVYHALYLDDLEDVVTTVFEPEAMEEVYRFNHELISPYVTGAEGETDGYTNLKSPEAFDASTEELISHVNSRYDAVMTYLATQTGETSE